ncbi:MAG: ATP-binding protein [Tenuifilaceae bacterium]|nr:ATP-binding protein [Tenuifilaceae bacterium]
MLQITAEFKEKVVAALLEQRANFDGAESAFARQWGISPSVFNRLKNGERDGLIRDNNWLTIGRELNVSLNERKWNMARTEVFNTIEEDIVFCKEFSKARICVDECGIGKTYSAKYLSRTLKNCFYVDASQAKTKQLFVRLIAKTIGVEHTGRHADVKANIKYYLRMLPKPMVIIDEAGDLDYNAFLVLKELWNATENVCGWYMLGADGLRHKIEQGIANKKVGFKEIFSRYSENYTSVVPSGNADKQGFYRKLITDVLTVNMNDKSSLNEIVKRCLITEDGNISGLRRAESLLILNQ